MRGVVNLWGQKGHFPKDVIASLNDLIKSGPATSTVGGEESSKLVIPVLSVSEPVSGDEGEEPSTQKSSEGGAETFTASGPLHSNPLLKMLSEVITLDKELEKLKGPITTALSDNNFPVPIFKNHIQTVDKASRESTFRKMKEINDRCVHFESLLRKHEAAQLKLMNFLHEEIAKFGNNAHEAAKELESLDATIKFIEELKQKNHGSDIAQCTLRRRKVLVSTFVAPTLMPEPHEMTEDEIKRLEEVEKYNRELSRASNYNKTAVGKDAEIWRS